MGSFTVEGVGHPVWDQESDCLELDGNICGISSMVDTASGVKSPTSFVYGDAKEPFGREPDGLFDDYTGPNDSYYSLKAWREWSGRNYPPVYRIKVTVEAEALSEEEAEKYFEDRKSEY